MIEFFSDEIWARPGLDKRTKRLITIAALMAMGRSKGLELNIRMAANNGATRAEIAETLLHLAPCAGFLAAWEALSIAREVFSEVDWPRRGHTGTKWSSVIEPERAAQPGYCRSALVAAVPPQVACHPIIDALAGMKGDKRPWVFRLNALFA